MDITIIATVLNLILGIVPQLTSSKSINSVVSLLVQLVPILTKEYQALLPIVQNIIALLQQNTAVTPAQLAALKVLDANVDSAFDAAWAAYDAAHPATS